MARYSDHDELAREALSICAAVRELGPVQTYHHLTYACQRDPERMAQLLMCLAAWVDFDGPTSALVRRAEAIVESRVQAAEARAAI
ncbi:hypothetical protein [Nocardia brasiliensis]|uniref:hypothetical protein n=1 Tax=Nocardia brasiliensis TaxID=37326 RepID=UPI00245515EB|nr:hypothetical protein [Nocardia brasiliensis]